MSNFGLYSEYYDLLYAEKDYDREAQYVNGLIHQHQPDALSILDLGCGTGLHAVALASRGYSVVGVDISPTMLASARRRQSLLDDDDIRKKISFHEGDVRTFRANSKFDVVLSLFHVTSYQVTNADLLAMIETAAFHLNPGGVLIFDYWYGPAVLTQRPEVRVKHLQNKKCKVLRIAEPLLQSEKNVVEVNYLLIIDSLQEKESVRIEERHKMRYLFLPEIEMLATEKFQICKHLAWGTSSHPDHDNWAGISILVRK